MLFRSAYLDVILQRKNCENPFRTSFEPSQLLEPMKKMYPKKLVNVILIEKLDMALKKMPTLISYSKTVT